LNSSKTITLLTFACFFFFVSLQYDVSYKLNTTASYCASSNTSFTDREVLHYKAYYNWKVIWIPAGEVKFTVAENSTEFKYMARGKSFSSYDNFFRVNDYYATTVDKKTMLPKTFVRYIEEGEYRKFDSLTFDHKNLVIYSLNGKTKEAATAKTFSIDSCTFDLLSVMYSLRNTNTNAYKPGESLDISMFLDEEVYPIHVVYDKKEHKKIKDMGKYNTLLIHPQLVVGNVFKKGDKMNIWVSDDENKVPLMIESPISIGSVKAVLQSYSGLRHDGEM
jgi:hypothetical protein